MSFKELYNINIYKFDDKYIINFISKFDFFHLKNIYFLFDDKYYLLTHIDNNNFTFDNGKHININLSELFVETNYTKYTLYITKLEDTNLTIDLYDLGIIPYVVYNGMSVISNITMETLYGIELWNKIIKKYSYGATMPTLHETINFYYMYDVYKWIEKYRNDLDN